MVAAWSYFSLVWILRELEFELGGKCFGVHKVCS